MNSNSRVLIFTVSSVMIYLLFSLIASTLHFTWRPFDKINLVADIIKPQKNNLPVPRKPADSIASAPPLVIDKIESKDFNLYTHGHLITGFNSDTTKPAINNFLQKLYELKTGKKRKLRVAYFGDSMIEGDLLTQTLRKLLQKEFGGNGVGFVPITSQTASFRQTASDKYSNTWQDDNFRNSSTDKLFLSGHLFHTADGWVEMTDQTKWDSTMLVEKSLLCGQLPEPVSITVNNNPLLIEPKETFNRIILLNDKRRNINVAITDDRLPVYGISFESESGIIVDNFSFRGITGIELNKIDTAFLNAVATNNTYDLLVFQYGVNVLFRPDDTNFSWYGRKLLATVKKIKNSFAQADMLIVSTADRAFRYDDEYKSATGIDSLVKVQAAVAYETGSAFYNQFATMGGTNSIVQWADASPSLANKDYVHPNFRGAEVLANEFYKALIDDYNKYLKTIK